MNSRIKKIYRSACKNKKFQSAIYKADKDKKPGLFAGSDEIAIFCAIYYGWLVSEYGSAWELHL